MSHKATAWLADLETASLTNGEFRVLFYLCDCHNPKMGCFPSQEFLREKTGLSNGGLNKVLSGLEAKGLLARVQRNNAETKQRLSSRYFLAFETEPTPLSGDGANSTFCANPSPLLGESQLHQGGDKPVKGTSKGTSKSNALSRPSSPDTRPAKARLPEDWALSDEGWAYARSQQIPDMVIEDEARGFHAYWADRTDADARKSQRGWEQCWASWCRRIASRYRQSAGVPRSAYPSGGRGGSSLASIAARRRAEGGI